MLWWMPAYIRPPGRPTATGPRSHVCTDKPMHASTPCSWSSRTAPPSTSATGSRDECLRCLWTWTPCPQRRGGHGSGNARPSSERKRRRSQSSVMTLTWSSTSGFGQKSDGPGSCLGGGCECRDGLSLHGVFTKPSPRCLSFWASQANQVV